LGSNIGGDAVATGEILDSTITSADVAADTLTAADLAVDSVDSSEIVADALAHRKFRTALQLHFGPDQPRLHDLGLHHHPLAGGRRPGTGVERWGLKAWTTGAEYEHMTTDAHPKPLGLPRTVRLRTLAVGAALVLLVMGVYVAASALFGGDDSNRGELKGGSKNNFTLSYPNRWRPLSSKELAELPGQPLAVVRRKDGKAFVVLRKEGRAPKNLTSFSGDLTKALDKRIPDFQKRSSKTIKLSGGNAFFYSYIRKSKGTVHTVVLVPNGKQSYVLNTVSRGGSEDVARQVARIILSFKT